MHDNETSEADPEGDAIAKSSLHTFDCGELGEVTNFFFSRVVDDGFEGHVPSIQLDELDALDDLAAYLHPSILENVDVLQNSAIEPAHQQLQWDERYDDDWANDSEPAEP